VVTASGTTLAVPQLSLAPGNTLLMLVQMLSYGLIFALVMLAGANRQRRLRLLDALFVLIVLHAGFAIVALTQLGDIVLVFPKWAYRGVATGTFVNRNSFATYLAMGLVLGTGLAVDELLYRSRTDRLSRAKDRGRPTRSLVLHVVGWLIVLAGLLATQSRMGIAAGAAGVLVVALPFVIALPLGRAWRLAAGLLALAAATGLLSTFGQGFLERLGSVEASADVRLDLYRQVLGMIAARPWVGYGGGAFEVAFPLFHQPPVSPDLVWDKAHNTYLALWAELGVIVGTIPILLMLGFAARLVVGSLKTADRLPQLVALGALVAVGAHSFVDFSLEIEANALLLLMLVGLGLAATKSGAASRRSGGLTEK
jgi:O-antigen ligase